MGSPDTPAGPIAVHSAARLDRLPLSRWHWKITLIVGIGSFFDLYGVFLGGVLGPVLAKEWSLGPRCAPTWRCSGRAPLAAPWKPWRWSRPRPRRRR